MPCRSLDDRAAALRNCVRCARGLRNVGAPSSGAFRKSKSLFLHSQESCASQRPKMHVSRPMTDLSTRRISPDQHERQITK